MKNWKLWILVVLGVLRVPSALAQEAQDPVVNEMQKLNWTSGPAVFPLSGKASIKLPESASAVSGADSDQFLKLTGNLPTPGTTIIVGGNWWATFDYEDSGYIKDDDKIDADALLKQIQASDGPANEERRRLGMPELHTDGWYAPPRYDPQTHNLEWGIRLHASDDPQPVINYTVRMLGRSGYERAVLVSTPDTLDQDVGEFRAMLADFDFNAGQKYREFKPGDHVAEFGLAALVAGGAAAAATKTGFWKVLAGALAAGWKLVIAAVVALFVGIGNLFRGKKNDAS